MPKNPKLEALKTQTTALRARLTGAPDESPEALRLTRELKRLDGLIDLYEQQDNLAAKIEQNEEKRSEQARKDETRLKVIVGASLLADAELRPDTRRGVIDLLHRAVTSPRDKQFVHAMLTTKGWV